MTERHGLGDRPAFETDTAVEAIRDRCFAATVTDRWNGLAGRPLGGYVLAVSLRAMQHSLPFPDLRVVSGFFLQPVDPGPVQIQVDAVRYGRRTASAEARLYQSGVEALRSMATFADLAALSGQNLPLGRPPDLPAPMAAIDLHSGGPTPTASIADRVEYRVDGALKPIAASTEGLRTRLWMRLKEGGGQDLLSLPFLVDAAPPAVLELGASGSTTVQLTAHIRRRSSSEWLACQATTQAVVDGYHDEDFEVWDEHGHLVAQSRQVAKLPSRDRLRLARADNRTVQQDRRSPYHRPGSSRSFT